MAALPFSRRGLAERIERVRGDLQMLLRFVRGEKTPALVARPRRANHTRAKPRAIPRRRLVVGALRRETDDAVTIVLRDPSGTPLEFEAGQFLTVELDVDGARTRRAYSLSSPPERGELAITVKRIAGGKVSTFVNERLREGDTVDVIGPNGSFTAPPATRPRRLVLVAGGSGITPIVSIAESVLAREPDASVTLIYGNRRARDVIFRDRIDSLSRTHGARFVVDHVLEEPADELASSAGRLDRATFEARLAALAVDAGDASTSFYVCGPEPMRTAVRAALDARGVPRERTREEIYVRPELRQNTAEPLPDRPVAVTVRGRGPLHAVVVQPGRTILESATAAGVELPFSCTMGGCGACKVKLVSGSVQMEEPCCLSDEERAAGFVLTCVGRPRSASEIAVETR